MIRSLKNVRREIRSYYAETCPIIPGKPGPVEPFSPRCFGETAEVWAAVDGYAERSFRYDMGGQDGRPVTPSAVEEAVALFRWILWTITPAQWQAMGVGYGDRMRALHIVRGRLKKMHWRDRQTTSGSRKASRRYRSYKASMSIAAPSPVAVAVAVEEASRNGLRGRRPGAGRPTTETRTVSAATARAAIVGEPMAEVVVGPVAVDGGVATIDTDGKMREVEIRSVAFSFFTGERIDGKWVPDGLWEQLEEIETAYRMVPGRTRVEYPRTFVAEAVDAGTVADRFNPAPSPAPEPWSVEQRGWRTTARETVRGQAVAADVEAYREALAAHYNTDKPLISGDPRRVRIVARWKLRGLERASR